MEKKHITEQNKKYAEEFLLSCKNNGNKEATIDTKTQTLYPFIESFDKDIKQLEKVDILKYFNDLTEKQNLKPSTAELRKIIIKQFYRYLFDGELPKFWKTIKSNPKAFKSNKHDDVLTQEEVFKMIDLSGHVETKAIIAVLYDGGFRVGELVSLNIGDIYNDGEQISIKVREVDGNKTGEREIRIPLILSAKYLLDWLEIHPLKYSNSAPLFTSRCHRTLNKRITTGGIYGIVVNIAKQAGITKHIDNHIFRHSRATDLDKKGYPQSMMTMRFGWTRNSAMLSKYSHQKQKDATNKFYEVEGLKPPTENKNEDILKPKVCPRCNTSNNATDKHCKKCWLPIDETTAQEELEKKKELEERVKLMEDFMTSTLGKIFLNLPVTEEKVYEKPVEDILADPTTPAYVTVADGGDKQTLDEMLGKFAHFKQVTSERINKQKGALLTKEQEKQLKKYKLLIDRLLT